MVDEANRNIQTQPLALAIFGITGDLTHRKLIPALYELAVANRLLSPLTLIGVARRDLTIDALKQGLEEGVAQYARTHPVRNDVLQKIIGDIHYIQCTFDDPGGYHRLKDLLEKIKAQNVLYYLATPQETYVEIVKKLGECGLATHQDGWRRIVIEKPYGSDLESAMVLDSEVHKVFREDQIYRIDHYLGKETVQNILVFRFANGIFEPLWNRHYIDHVQIAVAETIGVGNRAGYYENAGVIRDIFQNHLLQLVTLTAMETPVMFTAGAVRDEKVKILNALRPWQGRDVMENTFRAQYVSGTIDGKRVSGYKDEKGVSPQSITETYLAIRLFVDNWRWSGVPFYVRSGKRLPKTETEISIQFKQVPLPLFEWKNMAGLAPNVLVMRLQPDEGITLTFGAKLPGPMNEIAPVKMDFNYTEAFGGEPPEAYERLLLDAFTGDATLFTRSDEVEAAWKYTTQIIREWEKQKITHLPVYEAGTWGPIGADEFIEKDGREWRNLDQSVKT